MGCPTVMTSHDIEMIVKYCPRHGSNFNFSCFTTAELVLMISFTSFSAIHNSSSDFAIITSESANNMV
jgi:hypothetical protein